MEESRGGPRGRELRGRRGRLYPRPHAFGAARPVLDHEALRRRPVEAGGAPDALFSYAETWEGAGPSRGTVHLPYSSVSDVVWTWRPAKHAWLRSHGDVAHMLDGGEQVSASNVVIQVVEVTDSEIVDAAGNPSPNVQLTGSGRAYVLPGRPGGSGALGALGHG